MVIVEPHPAGPGTALRSPARPARPSPAVGLHLAVETVGDPDAVKGSMRRLLALPEPGLTAGLSVAPDSADGGLRVRSGVRNGDRVVAWLTVLASRGADRIGPRLLAVRGPGIHWTVGGLVPDPPLALLAERDVVLLEAGAAAWTVHLVVRRQPLSLPSPDESRRPCPVCRQPLGTDRIFRCACGAAFHHGAATEAARGAGSEAPSPACSQWIEECPVCRRPVSLKTAAFDWLPDGFDESALAESADVASPAAEPGGTP